MGIDGVLAERTQRAPPVSWRNEPNGHRRCLGRTNPPGTARCIGRTNPTGTVQRLGRTNPTATAQCLGRTKPTANRPVSWQNEPNPLLAHGSRLFARKRALGRDTSLRSTFPLPRPRTRRLFGRTKPTGIALYWQNEANGDPGVLAERSQWALPASWQNEPNGKPTGVLAERTQPSIGPWSRLITRRRRSGTRAFAVHSATEAPRGGTRYSLSLQK